MTPAQNSKNRHILPYLIGALIPLLLLAVFYTLSANKDVMERICTGFSTPLLRKMGSFYSRAPVSIMELFIIIAAAAVIVFVWKLINAMLSGRRPRIFILIRYILVLTAILAWIWNGYCWLWNTGYFGYSFGEKSGLEADGISTEDLYNAASFFAEKSNELSTQVQRDENGIFAGSFDDFKDAYDTLYLPLEEEFPFLNGDTTMPKGVYFSKIMSMTGFTGIFFPFSGETYINTHQPDWCIPDTIAHEIAHQRGVHLEAEANFTGISACIQSDDVTYQYSGYASGLIHLMNALYKADPDAWKSLRSTFTPQLEADWTENSRYWQEMEGTATKVSNKVYDTFLKVNTQPLGLQSYGACVDILVTWLNTSEYSPMS